MKLTDSLILQTLKPYVPEVAPQTCEKIRLYVDLLLRWNQRIALTTITDPLQVLALHFGESFFAASALELTQGLLVDVGSGGGFPGLALKILMNDLIVILVDSNSKKATFLAEVIRVLDLKYADVFRGRMEDFHPPTKPHFVTARALGNFDGLLQWSSQHLASDGRAILWLGGEDTQAVSSIANWKWAPRIQIPLSKNRFILAGTPIR
jgi:16S rRNA (guanine527-N7)-methyltransferase